MDSDVSASVYDARQSPRELVAIGAYSRMEGAPRTRVSIDIPPLPLGGRVEIAVRWPQERTWKDRLFQRKAR